MADAVENLGFVFSAKDTASAVATKAEENVEAAAKATEAHVEDLATTTEKVTQSIGTSTTDLSTTIQAGFSQTNMILRSLTMALTTSAEDVLAATDKAGEGLDEIATRGSKAKKSTDALGKSAEGLFGKLNFVKSALFSIAKAGGLGVVFGAGMGLGMKGITALISLLTKTLGPALEVIGQVFETTFAPISEAFYKLAVKLAPMISEALTPIVTMVADFIPTIGTFLGDLGESGGVMETVFGTLKTLFDNLKGPAMLIIETIANLAKKVLPILLRVFNMIFETVTVPLLTKIAEILAKIVARLAPIVEKLFIALEPIINTLVEGLAEMALTLLDELMPVLEPILEMLEELLPEFAPLLMEMVKAWLEMAKAIIPILPPLLKLVALLIGKILGPAFFKLMKLQMKMWMGLVKIFTKVLQPIVKWFATWLTKLAKQWTDMGLSGKETIDLIWWGIKEAWGWVVDKTKWLVDKVVGFFVALPEKIKSVWTGILDWIKAKVSGIMDFLGLSNIAKKVGGIFEALKAVVRAPLEAIKGFINTNVIDLLNKLIWTKLPLLGSLGGALAKANVKVPWLSHLQAGGIVTEPTIAALAERGTAEIVLPLEKTYIQRFMASVLPEMAPSASKPMQVQTDSELKGLLGKVLEQLKIIVGILGEREPLRAPKLGGGF